MGSGRWRHRCACVGMAQARGSAASALAGPTVKGESLLPRPLQVLHRGLCSVSQSTPVNRPLQNDPNQNEVVKC